MTQACYGCPMTQLDEQSYISRRWRNLVDLGFDPEEAYFRATAEFYSGNHAELDRVIGKKPLNRRG